MAYSTMVVHVDFDVATEARVRLAAGLADRVDATLIGVAACAPHPPFARGGVGLAPLSTEENIGDLKVALDQLECRFRSIAAAAGSRRVEWRCAVDLPTGFAVSEACAADLVIIGRERLSADPFRSLDPGVLLFRVVGRFCWCQPDSIACRQNGLRLHRRIPARPAVHSRTHCRFCIMPKTSSSWRFAPSAMPKPSATA